MRSNLVVIPAGRKPGSIFFGLFLFIASFAHAEATKEIYTDSGFYSANQNLFVYNGASPFTEDIDNTAPEGQKVFHVHQSAGNWSGGGIYNVDAPNSFTKMPQDYSDYASGSLRFWLKSSSSVKILLEYGTSGSQSSAIILPGTGNVWAEEIIPINNFGLTPSNLQQLESPFIITADAVGFNADYYFDHVRWTKPLQTLSITPSGTTSTIGSHREFTVEGLSVSGDLIDVYATWNVSGGGNSVSPGNSIGSRYTVLTMGGPGGTVNASADGIGGSVAVTPTSTTPNPFGIVSETLTGLTLDTDSKLLPLGNATLSDNTADFVEGAKSTQAQVNGPNAGNGWYVQWGLAGSPDTNTKDLSAFYDGSLRFWIKAPAQFQNNLQVSIRSGNVTAGGELSKVALAVTCDNTWRQVTLPLATFAKAAPWADLSRMKVLFAILTTAGVSGTFLIDNVRWDPTAPGNLDHLVISPASPVNMPLGSNRNFTAQGFDSSNLPVDILPTWTTSAGLGTISGSPGTVVTLAASASPISGTITASFSGVSQSVNVNVADPTFTQTYKVYTDAGAGGTIGVSQGPGATNMQLADTVNGNSAPGTTHYMHASWTLASSPGQTDAFAVWFVGETIGSRFMTSYADGYLQFWVRTTTDLQFSIRSANIPAGTELCKFRLSELGIPTNGNWQKVTLSLTSFKQKDPALDFSQIANYLTIGVLANQVSATSGSFDVANAQWLTTSTTAIDPNKVYAGLVGKQGSSGLVLSFDNDASLEAVTYDQALAAMSYIYKGDFPLAAKLFTGFQSLYTGNGFYDGYNRDTKAVQLPSTTSSRTAGPNAWMLLALMHYHSATGQGTYDGMMNGTAAWLLSLQDSDGGILFGYDGSGNKIPAQKSTEQNLDCYAAFMAYYQLTGNATYQTAAQKIMTWLQTVAWNAGLGRFNVGVTPQGQINSDKALDTYSWAPLATSSYTAVLAVAKTDLENTQNSDLTGFAVDGFDMGGNGNPSSYKDAVWLEGTAQMVDAYWSVKDSANANKYLNEIEKAIISTSQSTEGIPYATNAGTGFGGFTMDSLHPSVSSMAWYLFAKNRFNPFRPTAGISYQLKNIADGTASSVISWTVATVPGHWTMANQYLEMTFQPITSGGTEGAPTTQGATWETRIYTDNTEAGTAGFPQWQDPTPAQPSNLDSNPAGLIDITGSTYTQHIPLPMAWSVKDTTDLNASGLSAADPQASAQWNYFLDARTPSIDLNGNGTIDSTDVQSVPDNPEQDSLIVQRGNEMHSAQGPSGYFDSYPPLDIYFEGNFANAIAGRNYQTRIILESFSQ